MPKSRRRRKKEAKQVGKTAVQAPVVVGHPFADADYEKLTAAFIELSKVKEEQFPEFVRSFDALLREVFPLLLVGALASYGLRAYVSKRGVDQKGPYPEFSQHHVELAQALALMLPANEWGREPLVPQNLTSAFQALIEIGHAFFLRRIGNGARLTSDEDKVQFELQERLRIHTQVVRNWGSFGQVVRQSKALYGALDARFRALHGVTATELIDVFAHILSGLERKSTERMNMLADIFREPTVERVIQKYFELNPHLEGTPEEMRKAFPRDVKKRAVLFAILAHSDLMLGDHFQFSAEDVARELALDHDRLTDLLRRLAIAPGELSNRPVEFLFLDNPVWSRPLINLGRGIFYSAIPQAFFSHVHSIFTALCQADDLSVALSDRRSEFLEQELAELIARAFPSGVIKTNIEWRMEGRGYETDVLAVIDDRYLVIEAKAGAITAAALRGAPARAKRHVDELILEPSKQSRRFQTLLERGSVGDKTATMQLQTIGVRVCDVPHVTRLTATLDDFSVIASAERDLKRVGWVPHDHELAPVASLADLETVVDILEYECLLLDYFERRSRLQKECGILADELDWLGFYLSTGFNFAFDASKPVNLMLTGMSAPIDAYYSALDAGVELEKPKPRMAGLWRTCLLEIQRRRFSGWVSAASAVLASASPEEQFRYERNFNKLRKRIPAVWKKENHQCAGIVVPPGDCVTALAFFAYPPQLAVESKERSERIAAQTFGTDQVARCIVFGFDTSRHDDSVSTLGIFDRG